MLKKLLKPHSIIVTILILLFIWLLDFIRVNLHFLDPFNYGLKDYEITDIVFSQLRDKDIINEDRIVLVNVGQPDRDTIAKMINHINAAKASVIGVDVFFEERKDSKVDSMLHLSIKNSPNIVLANRLVNYIDRKDLFETEVGIDTFFSNYATMAFANFPTNDTRTIRYFSPKETTLLGDAFAFATSIIQKYDSQAAQDLLKRKNPVEQINYSGDLNSFIYYEPKTLLSIPAKDLQEVLKGKIVLLGYIGERRWNRPLLDRHFTPLNPKYTGRTEPDMNGLVIHANILRMILNRDYINQLPLWMTRLIAVIFCYFNVLLIHSIYGRFHEAFHGITRVLQIVEFVILFFIIAFLFYYFKIKFEFGLGILALLLAYDFVMIYESLIKKRIRILQKLSE